MENQDRSNDEWKIKRGAMKNGKSRGAMKNGKSRH
jgi:hypothetical protein